MRYLALTIVLFSTQLMSFGQDANNKDCYQIKYLDFFGLEYLDDLHWPKSEISKILDLDFDSERSNSMVKTNFLIPLIIYQLKEYHPNCNLDIDTSSFNLISELYFKIRDLKSDSNLGKSLEERIDFMRLDFYNQVENEKYLLQMIFTLDDGPFYGVEFKGKSELKDIYIQETNFGQLCISKSNEDVVVIARDIRGNTMWQNTITGLYGRNLTDLKFGETPIIYNSVATRVNMYAEGERFTLYLKKDGRFMYYFHSW